MSRASVGREAGTDYALIVERIMDWVPRAFAAVAGMTVAVWGVLVSWEMAFGASENVIAGLGMLLLVTPLLALLAAAVNFWIIDFVLTPVRWIVARPRPSTDDDRVGRARLRG
jgi:hypothetical protein